MNITFSFDDHGWWSTPSSPGEDLTGAVFPQNRGTWASKP